MAQPFLILAGILIMMLSISTIRIKQNSGQPPSVVDVCTNLKIKDFIFSATCTTNGITNNASLNLETCLGSKNGTLVYPGLSLQLYCLNCVLDQGTHILCSCSPTKLENTNNIPAFNPHVETYDEYFATYFGNRAPPTPPNLTQSYMDAKQLLTYANGQISC